MNKQQIKKDIEKLLEHIGVELDSEVVKNTPRRAAGFYEEALSGYFEDPLDHSKTFERSNKTGLIIIKDIEFSSLCQHHLLPFFGTVTIGYVPNKKVLGLSKFVRLVEVFSKRLQLQEHLTIQIMQAIQDVVAPVGVAIHIEAQHLCMVSRGVKNSHSSLITTEFSGILKTDAQLKNEFLLMLQIKK